MIIKPTKGEYLDILLRSTKTVFSTKDVALLWNESDEVIVGDRLKKYVNAGKLIRVRRGFYVKDRNYSRFELATRIYTPSYVSFETVLTREGVNFQYYGNIFVASYVSREIQISDQKITFIRMKDYVLSNTTGIEHVNGIATATKERALLDRVYVSKNYYFDNLRGIDWDMVFEILPIYHNKRMEKTMKRYFERYKKLNEKQ
ncbi:type IV toxin-antitoxin system AbiEi family antitoxin domain-containing protein [Candidatus Falkowbacteria bacterium]|nr:MAG: type IV toxin-antitoxin system AbiEi family antitoxin domain-containing protein [Candidatus Falkowbacteria bacterium]